MPFDAEPNRDLERNGNWALAVLRSDEVSEKEHTACLSARERARLGGIKNGTRSLQWLAGRLAAKYLFLDQLDMAFGARAEPWRPPLLELSSEHLRSLSPWMYREIEVLANGTNQVGYPRLVWRGKDSALSASMTHVDGMTCAYVSCVEAIGIDLEIVAPRVDSYYRENFTKAERNWVDQISGDGSLSPEWLYTFLWTLKEARLKTARSNRASVWDIPGIEIQNLASLTNILEAYDDCRVGNEFRFDVQIANHNRSTCAQVVLTATRHLILTLMMVQKG